MAEAFLRILLTNLNSLILKEFGSLLGLDKDLKNLSSTLSTIRAVLEDAEERQFTDKAIKDWLRKLKEAAYDADDILDECAIEASRLDSRSALNQVTSSFSMKRLNPSHLWFCHKIANRLQDVKERIDEIAGERLKFHLRESAVVAERRDGSRQSWSLLTEPEVYGRGEDAERVVQCLVNSVTYCPQLSVYPVVGMGGLGKTTLAQLVFNDHRISSHFELKIWVCVSDDFDVKRLITSIIESASGTSCPALEMDPLQKRLRDTLKGKRYLLVLDDVWSEDQDKWDMLKCVLACGSKGASVIVTTRLQKVASVVRTLPVHDLSCLSNDDCWSLFKQRAFGNDTEERPELVAIGKEIVKKCGGVPLAAKALGGLMRFKSDVSQWLHVKESELWNLPQEQNSIMPALRLSYSNLPLELRQCFAYCAIFPKDTVILKEELVLLWMANGFISPKGRLEIEDVGNEVWNELHWRSFFQNVNKDDNIVTFKMHDLVHDLARYVVEDAHCFQHYAKPIICSSRVRNIIIHDEEYVDPQVLKECQSVRTFLQLPSRFLLLPWLTRYTTANSWSIIGGLKHLRYLDLSQFYIIVLPNEICSLSNLQTLKLNDCSYLEKLPKKMSRLKNLRHLYLQGCISLHNLPPNLGQISCLQTLSLFIVDEKRGCGLSELRNLNLRGELQIKKLERVETIGDTNLLNKQKLRRLTLSWSDDEVQENAEQVLEGLEAPPNLKELTINGYGGINFPRWLKGPRTLKNIVSLKLRSCNNCLQLPSLWKLPCLKELHVREADNLECLHDDRYCGRVEDRKFPCLELICIDSMKNLKGLSRCQGREIFSRVNKLDILSCPKLILPKLPSVKDLRLWGQIEMALSSISNLRGLTCLQIDMVDDVDAFPGTKLQNLTVLQSLTLNGFTKLETWTKNPISLSTLKSLEIKSCPELESLSEQGLKGMDSLQRLSIASCRKFKSMSEGLQHLTALEHLSIQDCPNLVMLPESIKHLSCLRELEIFGQNLYSRIPSSSKLVVLPEALQHVPALERMTIEDHPHLASLPDWIGNLTSLQSLNIHKCSNLTSLPSSIRRLSNLQTLRISGCPRLQMQCDKDRGEDWSKIAHVPNLYV